MSQTPLLSRASRTDPPLRPRAVPAGPLSRRELADDFAPRRRSLSSDIEDEGDDYAPRRSAGGLRLRLSGGVARSFAGRVSGPASILVLCLLFGLGLWKARALLLSDPRLTIPSSDAIQISGNSHLSRPQLLSVFGEDVDRNVLEVPLADRREQLERLPWVEHATVMRLLPNRVRVAIKERTPVAFVRHGNHIGLVDAEGVLLDMNAEPAAEPAPHYSFPVVSGINAEDPLSTRAARMKLFERFRSELDAGSSATEKVSASLSEVDLSNPEDVKALLPSGSAEILVHFGQDNFLARYQRFQKNIPEWKTQYARLAAVDMRYERQVVLEMAPGGGAPSPESHPIAPAKEKGARPAVAAALTKTISKPPAAAKAAAASPPVATHQQPLALHTIPRPFQASSAAHPLPTQTRTHLQTAFDVHPRATGATPSSTPAQVPPQ